ASWDVLRNQAKIRYLRVYAHEPEFSWSEEDLLILIDALVDGEGGAADWHLVASRVQGKRWFQCEAKTIPLKRTPMVATLRLRDLKEELQAKIRTLPNASGEATPSIRGRRTTWDRHHHRLRLVIITVMPQGATSILSIPIDFLPSRSSLQFLPTEIEQDPR
ncbi:hypothetical protein BGZ83_002745, partial [Gryganskiella cystojenkinii]